MATNKKTVSVYADDDLLAALGTFKDSGNHKSLNVAIVAILREKLFGEVSDNLQSTLQSNVSSTLDIEAMIAAAIEKQSPAPDIQETVSKAIAPLLARLEALEINRSEATVPANFTSALLHKAVKVAPLMLQKSA